MLPRLIASLLLALSFGNAALAQQSEGSDSWWGGLMRFLGDNMVMGQYPYVNT